MNNYERLLIKISGESLGSRDKVLDFEKIEKLAKVIIDIGKTDKSLVIVVGGGNIFRGRNGKQESDSINNDFIGMTATVINALALGGEIKRLGVKVKTMSALSGYGKLEKYDKEKAKTYLEQNNILILGGGSGRPGITTDTTSAQRAYELDCEIILKGSTVDGVYDKDPNIYPKAQKYDELTFAKAIEKKLKIMDETAFLQCQENDIKVRIFNINNFENIIKAVNGEKIGTVVKK
jgi:uridylate kinase